MPSILEIAGYINDQGEQGRKRGLAQLLGQAYSAPPDQRQEILGTVAQRGGIGAAFDAEKHFSGMEDTARKRLGQDAAALLALPEEMRAQAYPEFAMKAQRLRIPAPLNWDPKYAEGLTKLANAYGVRDDVPSGYREFDMLAKDANLTAEDRALAARRELYLDRRPSNAALKYDGIEGNDGRTRQFALDPNAPIATQIGGPSAGDPFAFLADAGATVTSGARTPQRNAEVGGVPNSYHLSGQARDILPPQTQQQAQMIRQGAAANGLEIIDEGDHWHLEPRPGAGVDPFTSRRPEDEAGAKAAAERSVLLQSLPAELRLRVESALAEAAGKSEIEASGEIALADAQRARSAADTIGLLDEAERLLPSATGSGAGAAADAAAGFVGVSTPGARSTAALKTIAGQLVSKMPRMEGPQSDKDVQLYKDMAGNLADPALPIATRLAALQTIRRLNERYAGGPKSPSTQGKRALRYNPTTGDFE